MTGVRDGFQRHSRRSGIRAAARAWLEQNAERLKPGERAPGLEGRTDPEAIKRAQAWQAKKADAGWACITWPKEYGGRGATAIQSVVWNQEESRFKIWDTSPFLLSVQARVR